MTTTSTFEWIALGLFSLLAVASLIAYVLGKRNQDPSKREMLVNLKQRIQAWWVMVLVVCACFALGKVATLIFFGLLSFWALKEFITLTPTRRSDYFPLCLCFYVALPLQYFLIGVEWYGFFAILIPVYGFLLLPSVAALGGDTEHFLLRCAKIQWGLMLTVYCISYVPALLLLRGPLQGQGLMLMLYLLLVVQLSDVLQYVFGKLFGKRLLAPKVSPSKTVEGLVGGGLSATLIGACLWWMTPFSFWMSGLMAFIIVICGFLGGLTLSAAKRSIGTKDWGVLVQGHGGILDRLDSVCFAAPIFFHVIRYVYGA